VTRSWTDPDATPAQLDALRQILEGEYRPWCRERANARAVTEAKPNAKTTRSTPLFNQEAA
jgi:hypothetical protein